ncbi:hypothetical protein ACFSTC_27975 [Nonomuraea ferruginea]
MEQISTDQTSLAAQTFEAVRRAIVTGELAPGTLHSVVEIAAQLGGLADARP